MSSILLVTCEPALVRVGGAFAAVVAAEDPNGWVVGKVVVLPPGPNAAVGGAMSPEDEARIGQVLELLRHDDRRMWAELKKMDMAMLSRLIELLDETVPYKAWSVVRAVLFESGNPSSMAPLQQWLEKYEVLIEHARSNEEKSYFLKGKTAHENELKAYQAELKLSTLMPEGMPEAERIAVLSKDQIKAIGNTRIINEVLYENAASQGDPALVEGLECGEPYLRWAIGRKDLVLHPEAWVVPLRNKKKMLVAERSLHVDTGKNFTGSPPSKDLDLYSFEVPQGIGAIQVAAQERYGLEIGRADLEGAVVLGFWDAKLYWLFPKNWQEDVASRFSATIRDSGRLDVRGIADSLLLVPIDPFRKGNKGSGTSRAQLIGSLADRISPAAAPAQEGE